MTPDFKIDIWLSSDSLMMICGTIAIIAIAWAATSLFKHNGNKND